MDFLSGCPSVVDILHFVDLRDVLNCKLVNRYFYDVIRTNPKRMPKPCATMMMWIDSEAQLPCARVNLLPMKDNRTLRYFVYITENYTVMDSTYFGRLPDLYDIQGIPREDLEPANLLRKKIKTYDFALHPSTYVCFKNSSLEQRIQQLSDIIFTYYYCSAFTFRNAPGNWLRIVGASFKRTHIQCRPIDIQGMVPEGLADIVELFGCGKAYTWPTWRTYH